jgi:hypothetical protein
MISMKNLIISGLLILTSISAFAGELNCTIKERLYTNIDGTFSKSTQKVSIKYLGDARIELKQKLVEDTDTELRIVDLSRKQNIKILKDHQSYKQVEEIILSFRNTNHNLDKRIELTIDKDLVLRITFMDRYSGQSLHGYLGNCVEKSKSDTLKEIMGDLEKKATH